MKKLKLLTNDYESILSPLESDVINVLWPDKILKVRDIYGKLKKKKVALTSVAVILDRLHKKGIVDRKIQTGRGGLRYLYYPTQNKEQFEASVVQKSVDNLISKFGATAVNYFNERFSSGR